MASNLLIPLLLIGGGALAFAAGQKGKKGSKTSYKAGDIVMEGETSVAGVKYLYRVKKTDNPDAPYVGVWRHEIPLGPGQEHLQFNFGGSADTPEGAKALALEAIATQAG